MYRRVPQSEVTACQQLLHDVQSLRFACAPGGTSHSFNEHYSIEVHAIYLGA